MLHEPGALSVNAKETGSGLASNHSFLACRLATVLKSFALSMMYLPLLPIGVLLGVFMWGIYYWTYKYLLLRRCKRPYLQSALLPATVGMTRG